MNSPELVNLFFRRRWPDGFRCPRCSCCAYFTINNRNLPLYQCKLCGLQSSVTSGTVMHKTRTPLAKWAAAIEALSASEGMNAVNLARSIDVTHKVAWTILRKLRTAIDEAESARKLEGRVIGGLRALAPKSIWIFLPFRHYRCERLMFVAASVDSHGRPTELKIHKANEQDIRKGWKEPTEQGAMRMLSRAARHIGNAEWLRDARLHRSPLRSCFDEAKQWLVHTFNGIGNKYIQSYLNEFCFRWNVRARKGDLREEFYNFLYRTSVRSVTSPSGETAA